MATAKYPFLCTLILLLSCSFLSAQSISSCVPNNAPQGTSLTLTITGTGVDFNSATPLVDMQPAVGPTIYFNSFNVINGTQMDASFTIPGNATLGDYAMRVDGHTPYIPGVFTVTAAGSSGTLAGKVYHDVDENCVQTGAEPDRAGFVVHVTPIDYYAMTDPQGEYQALVPPGTYDIEVLPPPFYTQLCPGAPINATVTAPGTTVSGNDFAVEADTVLDASISCNAAEYRPGFNTVITVTVQNIGIAPFTGEAQIILDTNLTYVASSPMGILSGDTVKWTVSPAMQHGEIRNFDVTVNLPVNVTLGTIIGNTTWLVSNPADINGENNYFVCNSTVIGSYDPNDKTVWDQDMNLADPHIDASDTMLIYRIRFQNTGTASAINIFIRDTLDPLLDIGSMKMLGTSHLPYTFNITGEGFVEWRFPDIQLPDSNANEPRSHGYVLFSIKPKAGFTTGMSLRNMAHIYFDFNAPVLTNETNTSIMVATVEPVVTPLLKVYPNPASDQLHVELECFKRTDISLRLLDLRGVEVRKVSVSCSQGNQNFVVPLEGLGAGVYMLEAMAGDERRVVKVVIGG